MNPKKRVLILTADAGFGHRSAAKAIAAAIDEKYGEHCTIETVNPLNDEHTPFFLRRAQDDYDRIVRDWPELYKLGYQANDMPVTSTILESSLTVLLYEVMRGLVKSRQPDIIIHTYPFYTAPLNAYFTITNRYIPMLTVITDLVTIHRLWFHKGNDYTLVPTQTAVKLALKHDVDPDTLKLTGIPVNPQFAKLRGQKMVLRQELGWDVEKTAVLAVASKRVQKLPKFLRPLNHAGLPIQLIVVAGGHDELYRELETTQWHVPVKLYNYVDNMPALMNAADCLITKAGGLTVTEALACGLPMLLIEVIPGQETGNADFVVQQEAGDLVEKPMALLETLFHWLMNDHKLLTQRAQRAHALGKPNAAYDIADLAWETMQKNTAVHQRSFPLSLPKLTDLLTRYGVQWRDQ